jgi:translation initiation factor IF-1
MPSDKPRVSGIVQGARGNGFFSVEVNIENLTTGEEEQRTVLCQLSGKMRTNNIKVVEGDNVDVEIDPYDYKKGRIIYRKR